MKKLAFIHREQGWAARVNFTDPHETDPKKRYKSKQTSYYKTKQEARLAGEELEKQCNPTSITFGRIFQEYCDTQKGRVKDSTLATYPYKWKHICSLQNVSISDYKAIDYRKLQNELSKELSAKRCNQIHVFLQALNTYAKTYYDISTDAFTKVGKLREEEDPKEMLFFTYDEFKKFIKEIDDKHPIQYSALFRVLYYQGLRIGEANGLTWKDIDFKKNELSVRRTISSKVYSGVEVYKGSPKTNSSIRTLPMAKDVAKWLKIVHDWYQETYADFDESWYCIGGKSYRAETTIKNVKDAACDSAGVKRIRIHDFRHSCASLYISHLGAKPQVVQKMLGHSSLSITLDKYTHMMPNIVLDAINLLDDEEESSHEFSHELSSQGIPKYS